MPGSPSLPNRRTVLAVGGGAAAAALVAACGSSPTATTTTVAKGAELAAVSDIPDGGALVVDQVVLARTGDTVTAHSGICTHQGCAVVAAQSGDEVDCPCHGSRYTASTGAVLQGPATAPLPEVQVTVKNGTVLQG
ncbi:Rieske (2Fe-2S) protein [Nakamurella lactea]|uniref:Rieske (2Fe-2S) protein n=1 Tax=Nakamurella lactea TaxID=459515 RepID=UPI00041D504C|nr:Rieske (2Fe-2S) protein [Nakamurella lactea]